MMQVVLIVVLLSVLPAFSRAQALPPAPDGVIIEQDVDYLEPGREEKLDLYYPAKRAPEVRSPGVVIIHGGGWMGGDKAASREFNIGTNMALNGYVCVSVNYVLSGTNRWPTNLHDCKNGVRFLRANADKYQIDPDHIGVIGGSAGGHLALMVAYTDGIEQLEPTQPYPDFSSTVQAVVDMYGITNLPTRMSVDENGNPTKPRNTRSGLVSGSFESNPEAWNVASPVSHISKDTPPTLILHGTKDTTVNLGQSEELAAALAKHGVEHELVIIEGVGHTFDLETWARKPLPYDLRPKVIGFFDKHLKPSKESSKPTPLPEKDRQ